MPRPKKVEHTRYKQPIEEAQEQAAVAFSRAAALREQLELEASGDDDGDDDGEDLELSPT